MRKQTDGPASEMALEINRLLKKFLKKLVQEFNATLREQLIAEVREKLGLTDVIIPSTAKPAKKKKRAAKTVRAFPKKTLPVNWEPIKPVRFTKPKQAKKRAPTPTEPLITQQAKTPAIVTEKIAPELPVVE